MKNYFHQRIKEFAGKADFIDVRYEIRNKKHIQLVNNQMETPAVGAMSGGFVRALYKGGWGYATFNDRSQLADMLEQAVKQARLAASKTFRLAPVKAVEADIGLQTIHNPLDVPFADKVGILRDYSEIALAHGGTVKQVRAAYTDDETTKYYVNSEGTALSQKGVDCYFSVAVTARKDGQSQFLHVSNGSSNDFHMIYGFEDKIRDICKEVEQLLIAPKVKSGTYTVIADPNLGGVFAHESFGHTMEADKLISQPRLRDTLKIGRVFGSKELTIYDSGRETGSRGFYHYDDEGVPSRKTYLLKDGVLVGRLHTRETAAILGEEPTGNARAVDFSYPPLVRMSCTCIDTGRYSLEDMLADIDLGILAIDSHGGTGGEMFSFSASKGYMIRKGKIQELVRDVKLSGNLFATLKNIDMVGKDLVVHESSGGCGKGGQFPLPVATGAPYMRMRDVSVGGE